MTTSATSAPPAQTAPPATTTTTATTTPAPAQVTTQTTSASPAAAAPAAPASTTTTTSSASTETAPWSATGTQETQPTTENKTEAPQTGAPDKYSLKGPDGKEVDPASVEKLTSFAKERGLSNEQAQAIYDRDRAEQTAMVQQLQAENQKWLGTLQKEWGNDFKQNAEFAKRAFDAGDPDGSFRAALRAAHLDNHPQLVKFVAQFGRMMAEDKLDAPPAAVTAKENKPAIKRLEDSYRQTNGGNAK